MSPTVLQSDHLTSPGLRHGFFTRQGGVSEGIYASLNGGLGTSDDAQAVLENRQRMADWLGVTSDRFLSLWQIHSADVVRVTEPWPHIERPKADGMVTNQPGLALAIATADCGPVLFADAEHKVIGACHAGWKGAFTGVLEATLAAMEARGAKRDHNPAGRGPTNSAKAYEVGPEFYARFHDTDPALARFFTESARPDHFMFDLPAFIKQRLHDAGLLTVQALDRCTYGEPDMFYSYRRTTHRQEPDYGRLISAITLVPAA
jgi:YfiH family protein